MANSRFTDILDHLLTLHPWNFAIARKVLSRMADDPTYGWTYQFQLPVDPYCLHVLSVDGDVAFAVEGRSLMSDAAVMKIKYIGRILDMNKLSATFREAFAYYMAAEFAGGIVGEPGLQKQMEEKFAYFFQKAKATDAREGTAQQRSEGSWVNVRVNASNVKVIPS